MSFFDYNFDETTYFNERLLEIENLEVRKEAERIVNGILQPFYYEMNQSFRRLEDRLLTQKKTRDSLQIITSIKPRTKIDTTDSFLHPMKPSDMEEPNIETSRILNELNRHKKASLYVVYVETSYEKIVELLRLNLKFHAEIETEFDCYSGKVCLEVNHSYQAIIQKLYESFIKNGLRWKTVNAPFLHKLLNVILIEADLPKDEEIKSIKIDFREFQDIVRFDYVPLWNVTRRTVMTSVYPRISLHTIHYEHIVQGNKLHRNCDYIVKSDRQVWDSYRINEMKDSQLQNIDDLLIECDERKPVRWSLWEVSQKPDQIYPAFQLMENERINLECRIRTQAEAIKFAEHLSVNQYIRLSSVSTVRPNDFVSESVYDMGDYLPKGIRDQKLSPKLYFECEATNLPDLWRQDILSYFLSRFQSIYPEYQCVGRIIK